ncbi:hypothetical protein [Nocardioides sp.]|uniref:hypothetical protein n=1 Tax=Nocardioides sp. TaxID=35761 RepID=UPI0027342860|nr:hypothetical protein [Nocardioides sp.]MDP3890597.1 hypothetical protein [Nocardioides sp.]
MSSRRVLLAAVVPAVFLTGMLAACGEDPGTGTGTATDPATTSSGSPTPAGDEGDASAGDPQCAEVWVDGEELPEDYAGCYEGEAFVDADGRHCAFGTDLFTYADSFYAAAGSRVNEVDPPLAESEAYLNAADSCGG